MATNSLGFTYAAGSPFSELQARVQRLESENHTLKENVILLKQRNEESKKSDLKLEQVKKRVENTLLKTYEVEAMGIEKEEKWKNDKEELTETLRQYEHRAEERFEECSTDIQTISTAITALQSSMEEISSKMEQMEENHNKVLERLGPLEERTKFEPEQGERKYVLIFDNRIYSNKGPDEAIILNRDKWVKSPVKLYKTFADGGAIYLDEEIYFFGGTNGKELNKIDKNLKSMRLADMNTSRSSITNSCLEWNGSIWVFGGTDGNDSLRSVERYDPKSNKWIEMPYMKTPRSAAAAVVWKGKFIICGGVSGASHVGIGFGRQAVPNILKSVECFDPESGVWIELNNMPIPRSRHSIISHGDDLILLGGSSNSGELSSIVKMSTLEDKISWKEMMPMKESRESFFAAVINDEIFVIGGRTKSGNRYNLLNKCEVFKGESRRDGPLFPYPCLNMSAVVVPQYWLADILCSSLQPA